MLERFYFLAIALTQLLVNEDTQINDTLVQTNQYKGLAPKKFIHSSNHALLVALLSLVSEALAAPDAQNQSHTRHQHH